MRITYDPDADVVAIYLRKGHYAEGNEIAPNVIMSVDEQGDILDIEILNARQMIDDLSVTVQWLVQASTGRTQGGE